MGIKLACNYFIETEELVADQLIDIDYFKYPSVGFHMDVLEDLEEFKVFASRLLKLKPILLHGLFPSPHWICSPGFIEDLDLSVVKQLLSYSQTPGISLHLSGMESELTASQLIDIVSKNVNHLRDTFPGMQFISLENVEKSPYDILSEPAAIKNIILESKASFLLDITHALWAADYRGEKLTTYLKKLPLDQVNEIHINGWVEKDGDKMPHTKINPECYEYLKYLMGYCSPDIITLEYGRAFNRFECNSPLVNPHAVNEDVKKEIVEQINELRKII